MVKLTVWLLLLWGGFSFVCVLAFVAFLAFKSRLDSQPRDDFASPHDVRFVLNWCGLGDDRIERVVHSHASSRDITGDYLDAYAIKISRLDLSEITSKTNDIDSRWYRGDQLPPVLDDAVKFTGECEGEVRWFPAEAELRSADIYVYPWNIKYYGVTPSAAKLIFIRPADKMVFYFGTSM